MRIVCYGASVTQQYINKEGENVGYVAFLKEALKDRCFDSTHVEVVSLGFGSNHLNDAGFLYLNRLMELAPDLVILDWHTTSLERFDEDYYGYIQFALQNKGIKVINVIFPRLDCLNQPERDNIKQARWYENIGANTVNFYKLIPNDKDIKNYLRDVVHTNFSGGKFYASVLLDAIDSVMNGRRLYDNGCVIEGKTDFKVAPVHAFNFNKEVYRGSQVKFSLELKGSVAIRLFSEMKIGPYSPFVQVNADNKNYFSSFWDQWCTYERRCLKAITPFIQSDQRFVELFLSIIDRNPNYSSAGSGFEGVDLNDRKVVFDGSVFCVGGQIKNIEIL